MVVPTLHIRRYARERPLDGDGNIRCITGRPESGARARQGGRHPPSRQGEHLGARRRSTLVTSSRLGPGAHSRHLARSVHVCPPDVCVAGAGGERPCQAEDLAVPVPQVEGTSRPGRPGRRAGQGRRHPGDVGRPGAGGMRLAPEQAPYSMQRKQIMMDPAAVPRSMARLQYTFVRLPLTLLDEGIVARYWGQNALVRRGLERVPRLAGPVRRMAPCRR